jgi:D-glycero-D-manno-heptose 1,7-bisphosphate phosphatase
MIEEAVARHGFDPARGFVIGDKGVDVALGRAVGATTLLVRTGYGELALASGAVDADHVVADLAEAAAVIERIVKPT